MCIIKITPISPGMAKGKIVFVTSRERPLKFYKDKIAVIGDFRDRFKIFQARMAEGIIAERGGITSHGAILARELKIPGIILPNARKILKENKLAIINQDGTLEIKSLKRKGRFKKSRTRMFFPKKVGNWILIRPRCYCRLRFDLVVPGIEKAPKILWGSSKIGEIKQTSRGYWYKNFPTPLQLSKRIFKDPAWFNKKIKERRIIFAKLKKYLSILTRKLKKKLSAKEYLDEFLQCRDHLNRIRPYVDLIQLSVDQVEREFYRLLLNILPPFTLVSYFDQSIKTSLAKRFAQKDIKPPKGKKYDFVIPAPPIFPYIKIKTKYNFSLEINKEIKGYIARQSKIIRKKFYQYAKTLPLLAELSEETSYNTVVIIRCLNYVAAKLAFYLERNKKLKKANEVFDLTVDRFVGLVRSIL